MDESLLSKATDPSQYDNLNWALNGLSDSPRTKLFGSYILSDPSFFENKDVLDIGSGAGWLLEEMHNAGARSVLGIEPSQKNVDLANEHHPEFTTICTTLEGFSTKEVFDVVTSIHVMVHIADLDEVMKKIAELLRENGDFFLIIPDFEYARMERHGYEMNIDNVGEDEYIVSTKRPNGVITDIIRKPEVYVVIAQNEGLFLVDRKDILPVENFLEANNAGEEFRNIPLATFLRFRK